jgi:hypothetical protein
VASGKTEIILSTLTTLRLQTIAYHQMRTQAVVFIAGLSVAAAGYSLSQSSQPGWMWIALYAPYVFLAIAFYLSQDFRQILDCCHEIEKGLHDELQKVVAGAPDVPEEESGDLGRILNYALILQTRSDLERRKIRLRWFDDAPQRALVIYAAAYLLFWFLWFKPWRLWTN